MMQNTLSLAKDRSALRKWGEGFIRAVSALSTFAGWCSAGMIVIAVGLTCGMIFIRFVLNGSTVWQTEAVIYLVVGATLIGLPYVQRLKGHVNVDLLPLMLRPKHRFLMFLITYGLSIAIITVMLYYSYEYWHFAWEKDWRSDTIWRVQLWIPYIALPIGFGLYVLQLAADVLAVVLGEEKPFGLEDR